MSRWSVLAVVFAGCAAVETTCPTGSRLLTEHKTDGHAEYCSISNTQMQSLPTFGRTSEGSIGTARPDAMPASVEGPYTSWYANGKLASHGRYVSTGSQSLPEGLWAFWYPSGKRQVYGLYHLGEPVGCFVTLDENGAMSTGTVKGSELTVAPCTPPPDNEIAIIEGIARAPVTPPWIDFDLRTFLGPNKLGAENSVQATQDPGAILSLQASARIRRGRLRIGPVLGLRLGNEDSGQGTMAGAAVAWELPKFSPRIDTEVGAELSAEYLTPQATLVTPALTIATANASFWTPVVALQANMALTMTSNVSMVIGLRVEDSFRHDVNTHLLYCDEYDTCGNANETWSIGGFAFGANLGVRFLLR